MAELMDNPEVTEEPQEELALDHDLVEEVPEETTPNEDDDLPEKYRGKSKAEIARMHEEAQSLLGRQSSEVGELRKVFDEYIQGTMVAQEKPVEEDPVDFLLEPEKAVQRAIDNHPKIKQAEAVVGQVARQQNLARLTSEFPDLQSTLQDPKFQEWVGASNIRRSLYQKADTQYDYESAAELLSNWKDRNVAVERTKEMEKQVQKSEVTKASTGDTRAAPTKARKKIYRRADIINLMKTDPSRYAALQPEIMAAYQEGRVK